MFLSSSILVIFGPDIHLASVHHLLVCTRDTSPPLLVETPQTLNVTTLPALSTPMTSPQSPAPIAGPRALKTPVLDVDTEYADSQLKPAPLRLGRKRNNEHDESPQDAGMPEFQGDGPGDKRSTSTVRTQPRESSRSRRSPSVLRSSPTPESRPPPPTLRLASLVSKYEVLDAISHVDARDFALPSSPRRHPRTPIPARNQTLQDDSPAKSLFKEESPFRKPPRLGIPISDRRGSSIDKAEEISPTTVTSPAAFRARLKSVAPKVTSPLKKHEKTNSVEEEHGHQQKWASVGN